MKNMKNMKNMTLSEIFSDYIANFKTISAMSDYYGVDEVYISNLLDIYAKLTFHVKR